jgi:hypothetical protein
MAGTVTTKVSDNLTSIEPTRVKTIRELRELIVALDRRMPRVERVGEVAIARDAAGLRTEALRRIEELERDTPIASTPAI